MNLTASSLWRSELCPASAVLPWQKKEYADAKRGVAEHAALEANPPPGSLAEVAYVWNVLHDSAREVGRSLGRNYGQLSEGDIPGTADLITPEADHVLVTDFKTGVGHMQAEPAINPQLQHQALCAATVLGKQKAIVQLVYTRTGEVKDAAFDLFDFDAIRVRLKTLWTRCKTAEVVTLTDGAAALVGTDLLVEGDGCWRCPAKKACPIMGGKRG